MINFFDLFVIVTSIGLAISGFREGLVRGIVKLAGFFITLVILAIFANRIKEFISVFSDGNIEKILIFIAFIVVFIALSFIFHILAAFLDGIIKFTPIYFINSGMGCLLGLLKATLLCGLLAILLSLAPNGSFLKNQFNTSNSAGIFKTFANGAIPFLNKKINSFVNEEKFNQKENNDEQNKPGNPDYI